MRNTLRILAERFLLYRKAISRKIKIGPPDIDMPGNAKPGILSLLF